MQVVCIWDMSLKDAITSTVAVNEKRLRANPHKKSEQVEITTSKSTSVKKQFGTRFDIFYKVDLCIL